MILFSQFVAHFTASRLPPKVRAEIRAAAIARVTERQRAGRADCALDFTDLVNKIEAAIC